MICKNMPIMYFNTCPPCVKSRELRLICLSHNFTELTPPELALSDADPEQI